mgnify:FL=1
MKKDSFNFQHYSSHATAASSFQMSATHVNWKTFWEHVCISVRECGAEPQLSTASYVPNEIVDLCYGGSSSKPLTNVSWSWSSSQSASYQVWRGINLTLIVVLSSLIVGIQETMV